MRSRGTTVQRSVRKIVLRIAAIVLRSGTHESQVSQHVVVSLGTTYDLVTRCMWTRLHLPVQPCLLTAYILIQILYYIGLHVVAWYTSTIALSRIFSPSFNNWLGPWVNLQPINNITAISKYEKYKIHWYETTFFISVYRELTIKTAYWRTSMYSLPILFCIYDFHGSYHWVVHVTLSSTILLQPCLTGNFNIDAMAAYSRGALTLAGLFKKIVYTQEFPPSMSMESFAEAVTDTIYKERFVFCVTGYRHYNLVSAWISTLDNCISSILALERVSVPCENGDEWYNWLFKNVLKKQSIQGTHPVGELLGNSRSCNPELSHSRFHPTKHKHGPKRQELRITHHHLPNIYWNRLLVVVGICILSSV